MAHSTKKKSPAKAADKAKTVKQARKAPTSGVAKEPGIALPLRQSRIEIRIDEALKQQMEAAASLLGLTLSAFMVSTAITQAREVLTAEHRTILSLKDWNQLQKLLETSVQPSDRLKRAIREYKKHIGHSDGL